MFLASVRRARRTSKNSLGEMFAQEGGRPDLTVVEREANNRHGYYLVVGGGAEGEWLKMEWRADTPREQRGSLLRDVKQ
jgi:hypothetical protein